MNKTCSDCIHDKVCDMWAVESGMPFVNADTCEHYQDKSRYIELPCAVGDTVFYIDTCRTAEDYGKKFINSSRVKRISIDNEFAILHDHSVILFENLFRTKEETEKALKGGAE